MAIISKKSWSAQTVFMKEKIDIRYALAEVAREKDLSNCCNEDQKKYSLLRRTWRLVLLMECIPSKLGQDWWNETLTRGMNLKNLSLLYYSFGGDLRSPVYVLLLQQKMSPYSLHVFWSLDPLGKICLLQKWLPLRAVKAMVIFHEYCDCWCLYSCDYVRSKNNNQLL